MTPVEALEIALSQEEDAIKLYSKLAAEHPALQDILYFLLNEEEKHKKLIRTKMAEITRI